MYRPNNGLKWMAATFLLALAISGCAKDDKKEIIGIWQMAACRVNGNEIGDGKGYMHFRADDSVYTRTGPAMISAGKYSIAPEEKKIYMIRGESKVPYDYEWVEDTLVMRTGPDSPHKLEMRTYKVEKLPVERGAEKPSGPSIKPQ